METLKWRKINRLRQTTFDLSISLTVIPLIGSVYFEFRFESVYGAQLFPAPRQVIRLLILNRRDVVLLVDAALDLELLHEWVMAVVVAERDERLFHLLALYLSKQPLALFVLRGQILLVILADLLHCFDRDYVFVVDAHAFEHF